MVSFVLGLVAVVAVLFVAKNRIDAVPHVSATPVDADTVDADATA